ncbi:MAG: hypothetical protein G01um101420_173 [Parcubacteria group bacterium Gr01-1014_20]|nr:MAG: hypothetical protein G01um101420_173 [Parcubacteria group bacterium Gr01-1014_20]
MPGAFSTYLESYSLELMDTVVSGDFSEAKSVLTSLDYTLRLANEVGALSQRNFDIIQRETYALTTSFGDLGNSATSSDVDLDEIFKSGEVVDFFGGDVSDPEDMSAVDYQDAFVSPPIDLQPEAHVAHEAHKIDSAIASEPIDQRTKANPEIRQSAILDRIRQRGYCRLRDIEEAFVDTSERTLRYDLQRLIEQDLVERIGSGGPASFYRVKRPLGEVNEIREV